MKMLGAVESSSMRYLILCTFLLLFGCQLLSADDKKPKEHTAPAAPAKPAAHAPGASGNAPHSNGPTTAGHSSGPTTAGHSNGPTTAGHSATTAGHSTTTTTAGHTATTTTTTIGHSNTATGHNTTTGAAHVGNTVGHPGVATRGPGETSRVGSTRVARGSTVVQTKSGGVVTKRADGKVASFHDPKRGMEVHRSLSGNRQVIVDRPDHSRVFVERGGHGYVQRPYMYRGHEYAQRSYYYRGTYYHYYYGRYYYRGVYVNPYYPAYYYAPAYYGWVYNPWATPVAYAWGWGAYPWYGYYGAYFTPYPVYAGPAFWLTDFMISTSLAAAYQAQVEANANARAAALNNPTPLTPETKALIAEEVRRQVALENAEARTGQTAEPDPASSSIQRSLSDGVQHVFVAGRDLDVVDASGAECAISQGDALQLTGQNSPDATSVNLAVLASKGGRECPKGDTVAVSLQDLQDMQNHMRQVIDQGMQELQKKQGQGGLPAAPASTKAPPVQSLMALNAPPPPPEDDVRTQLNQEVKEADVAEKEAVGDTTPTIDASAGPPTVRLGQTTEQVAGALGKPKSIMDLGSKKIYVYPDMKVTFNDGKVTDIK